MDKSGKALRTTAIIFLGGTAAMNLLGGIGTTCAAFSNNVGYKMAFRAILDYRWLYQSLVVTTILIGLVGISVLIKLIRGGPNVYRNAIIVLVIGTILGGIQFYASMTLRGKAVPANVKFYVNLITLIVFLAFKLPSLRDKIDFSQKGESVDKNTASGLTAIIAGALMLSVFFWAGPSHTFYGENWTYVFFMPLVVCGALLVSGGVAALIWVFKDVLRQTDAVQAKVNLP
jgi:hypothetical protein